MITQIMMFSFEDSFQRRFSLLVFNYFHKNASEGTTGGILKENVF